MSKRIAEGCRDAQLKILTVSDIVVPALLDSQEIFKEHRDVQLILSCGDLPPEYLTGLRHRFDVPLYYILGNHDIRYGESPPTGCRIIDRQVIVFGKYRLAGFSGSRWYNGGMNQYSEKEMRGFITRMRLSLWRHGKPDIVITHAPPRHVGDAEDPCHKGFRCFVKFIQKYNPAFFIHGHIHRLFEDDRERITRINSTQVINSYGYHVLKI